MLICGSRGWKDESAVEAVLAGYKYTNPTLTLIHGHCKDGADAIADRLAHQMGVPTVRVAANWQRFGKRAGVIRNQKMLDEQKPDVVVAFRAFGKSAGTDDMVQRALKAGVTTFVIHEGGSVEELFREQESG